MLYIEYGYIFDRILYGFILRASTSLLRLYGLSQYNMNYLLEAIREWKRKKHAQRVAAH